MSFSVITLIVEVALFGCLNGGLMLYKFGRLEARVDAVEEKQRSGCPPLAEVVARISHIEGALGIETKG